MPSGVTRQEDAQRRMSLPSSSLAMGLALALAIGLACSRSNPAYQGPADGAASDGPATDLVEAGGEVSPDAVPDTGALCVVSADCMTRNGPPVCGVWECRNGGCTVNCPNCTDNDRDGYGVGAGCAGPDCDDNNPTVFSVAQRNCYDGAAGTAGKGTCRLGSQLCTNGVWTTTCNGEVIPSGEACNGQDDDCNGVVDDNLATADNLSTFVCGRGACQASVPACAAGMLGACVPHATIVDIDDCNGIDDDCDGQVDEDCAQSIIDCIHVAPNGQNDVDGSIDTPLATIEMGILRAVSAASKTVCVAGGRDCTNSSTYSLGETANFVMANGVSLYGNYESRTWTRCPLDPADPAPNTTLEMREAGGVRFPPAITTPTTLDGFVITRATAATTTAITINAAKQVRLSNLVIDDAPTSMHSYGVNMLNGAEALITHSLIEGGDGTLDSIGVRSVGSKPTIRENCSAFDAVTGRCTSACAPATGLGIRGRSIPSATGLSTAVHLEASPGALVETSTVCGDQGQQAIGVRLVSDATDVAIRGNMISGTSGVATSLGVWAEDCNGATPWIVGNQLIEGQGAARAVGVLAVGSCHPVIDGNAFITAGGQSNTTMEADGIACQANTNMEPSLCAVLGNDLIQGSTNFRPATSAAVACRDRSCARVAGNVVQGNMGGDVIGVFLRHDGTVVEQNRIVGGCGLQSTSGILADDAFSRIQNNVISGGTCTVNAASSPLSIGLRVYDADNLNELDIHSNTIDGGGNTGACTSIGIEYGVGPETPPTAPKGIVRDNILRGGACTTTHVDFAEVRMASDPRIFQNNDLDPAGTPASILYLDENTTALRTTAAVNGLTDLTSSRNNLSVNPMFVAFPTDLHLNSGSACVGAGTSTGAPATDFDGKPRSANRPTIGAFE